MWNNVSFAQYVPDIDLSQHIPNINVTQFLPAVPHRFYSSAGSMLAAAAVGGGYGLIGRMIYPKAGISPLHYAVWFVLAYQIKQLVLSFERHFGHFLDDEIYDKLDQQSEDELDFLNLIRYHCWKVIHWKQHSVQVVDDLFSRLLNIRPFHEVTEDNIEDASFLEMCRYRIWPVFKLTVLDTLSFAVAHQLSNEMGFYIPNRTAVPLLIVIRSIVKDIILVPSLYVYARLCNRIADDLNEGDDTSSAYRAQWIRWCLPEL